MENSYPQQQQVLKLRLSNTTNFGGGTNTQQLQLTGPAQPPGGEFTRRKNWSSSVLESVRDVLHVLNADLCIIYCSAASSEFLGYKPAELVDHLYTEYIHVDDVDMFIREFRKCKTTCATLSTTYRFLRKDGKYTTLETKGRFHKNSFFGSSRKIPTGAAHAIDSFLDLKMENELLKRKLSMLKTQHNKRGALMTSQDTQQTDAMSTSDHEEDGGGGGGGSSDEFDELSNAINASNVYTQGVGANLDIAESLSLFTGLRYDLGERSVGISLGLEGGELTTVGMDQIMNYPTIVSNAENLSQRAASSQADQPRAGKKKRLTEPSGVEEMKICIDCGTTEAPEWRRGPSGPKTLCNACGLRWSKNKKKLEKEASGSN